MDYARFITTIDSNPNPSDLLFANALETMLTPTPTSRSDGDPYGMSWHIDESNGEISHSGSTLAATANVVRRRDGVTFVVICNTSGDGLFDSLQPTLKSALSNITSWPLHDLFPATLSYPAWKARHFTTAEQADPAISGDEANPDGDHLVNLLEYAFGYDPKAAIADGEPTGSLVTVDDQRYLALTFRRLALGHALDYAVDASTDLETGSPVTEPAGAALLNDDGTLSVTIRDVLPVSATAQRLVRLRVSRQ